MGVDGEAGSGDEAHPDIRSVGGGSRGGRDVDVLREAPDGLLDAALEGERLAVGGELHAHEAGRAREALRGLGALEGRLLDAHEGGRAQHVEAADGARGDVDAAARAQRRFGHASLPVGVGERACGDEHEVTACFKHGFAIGLCGADARDLDDEVGLVGEELLKRRCCAAARVGGERLGVRLRSGHDARERPALGPGKVRDKNGAQGTAADDGGSLHDGSPMFDNSQELTATQ